MPLNKTCSQCQTSFVMDDGEVTFFERKGLLLPSRCKPCRQRAREGRQRIEDLIASVKGDVHLTCDACENMFVWSRDEQVYFRQHNLKNMPRHCHSCREHRKLVRRQTYGAR